MDSFNYNPGTHLGEILRSPDSLRELPQLLAHINLYKLIIDDEMATEITKYDSSAKVSITSETTELISLLKEVKAHSSETQKTISEMTISIQQLDQTKKNLVTSMTVLKRLQMLINANNTLVSVIPSRNYQDILQLLSVIKELLVFFKPYKLVDEINQLNLMTMTTQNKLVDDIFLDFEEFLTRGAEKELIYGCQILELVDLKYKDKLLTWFYNLQLKDIKEIFNNLDEAGSLDNLNRRYIYFKNTLNTVQKTYLKVFPSEWKVDLEVSKLFCKVTKQDLENLLGGSRLDSKNLLSYLTMTLEFEKSLNENFKTTEFSQIISHVFEPYLLVWVQEQDKVLNEKMSEFLATSQLPQEFAGTESQADFLTVIKVNNVPNIANSSTELFKTFQRILTQILKLSNGEILIDLNKLFIKYLFEYHNRILLPIIPRSDEDLGTGLEPLKYLTMLLNTGDYILNNIEDLGEKFASLIREGFRPRLLTFDHIRDLYYQLINKAISNLLIKISNDLKPCWRQLINNNWHAMENVGDNSNYIGDMEKVLVENLQIIHPLIIRDSYIRNFNDKLVELLVSSIANNLKLIKPLNILNVEQLLVDMSSLKEIALKFPSYGAENKPSKAYEKFVSTHFHELESLLKLLLVPTLPVENLIEQYFELIGDKSLRNFSKLLNIKNIEKADQRRYTDNFKLQLQLDDGSLLLSSILSNVVDEDSPVPEVKSPKLLPKINNFEKNLRELAMNGENHVNKLNENFRSFGKFLGRRNG